MNRIKEILKAKGITQTWLAEKMNKSYTTINEYARNVRQPSVEDLYEIADILQVQATDLLVNKKNNNDRN
ncbi:helix-turn-helix protein [Salinivirga cyanobacteriivorans]|jgi:transcriptional regulator with XRE-family HTH domain|uniref:Helix-turn-helix protein n=1 Tax=Salinivirga cyanobacteriivorans TaxID=1307839 RepID=A0A0S2HVJ2_9BACT|nr:helix-turn-helix transcriptional regulator [Salinivirga cyanobacteriivorans]ALO14071.1 helix-turn-helix protein [Salinivirga cyanobacteriivorans]